MSPADVVEALPVIRARCEEVSRDPATLAISVHVWGKDIADAGRARIDRLAGFREAGVSRVMGLVRASTATDEALESLAEDAREAGVTWRRGDPTRQPRSPPAGRRDVLVEPEQVVGS
jgi:hypothetical protein